MKDTRRRHFRPSLLFRCEGAVIPMPARICMLYPGHKAVSDYITMPAICKGDRRRVWRTQRAAHSLGVAYQEFDYCTTVVIPGI